MSDPIASPPPADQSGSSSPGHARGAGRGGERTPPVGERAGPEAPHTKWSHSQPRTHAPPGTRTPRGVGVGLCQGLESCLYIVCGQVSLPQPDRHGS